MKREGNWGRRAPEIVEDPMSDIVRLILIYIGFFTVLLGDVPTEYCCVFFVILIIVIPAMMDSSYGSKLQEDALKERLAEEEDED